MKFKPRNFDAWKESDVREFLIAPLLTELGYEKDTENDITTELYLQMRVSKNYFGKLKATNEVLTGYADYRLDAGGKVRWVIEAKSPAQPITEAEIEQAYHYARHPEVRAVLFCICNGRELKIFRTDYNPQAAEVESFIYEELEQRFDVLRNILSPQAMLNTWSEVHIDVGKPLGLELGSLAQVTGGQFRYTQITSPDQSLKELIYTVMSGSIYRDENSKLTAFIRTLSPLQSAQELAERLGTDKLLLTSNDETLSTDHTQPTVFRTKDTFAIPRGARVLNFQFPMTFECDSRTEVSGYLDGHVFKGRFHYFMRITNFNQTLNANGIFEVHVAS